MRVCQETIYTALCTLPRGELCDEQLKTLRQGREASRPHAHGEDHRSKMTNMISIHKHPPEVRWQLFIRSLHFR